MSNWQDSYNSGLGGGMKTPTTDSNAYAAGLVEQNRQRQALLNQQAEIARKNQADEKARRDALFRNG